jgi:hemoglobin-like flavoprotein
MIGQHDNMREIMITLRHNAATQHWSVDIDGERYDHVTTDIIETLVESRLILAETSLTSELV